MEFNIHVTSVGYFLCVIYRLRRIREELSHLFLGFHIILSALIAHAVFIRQFLSRLNAEKYVMRIRIFGKCIMAVICRDQLDPCIPAHPHQSLIDQFLRRYAVILHLQKKIIFSKNIPVAQSSLFCLIIHARRQIARDLSRQTRGKTDDPLMILFKKLHIYSWFVIIPVHKAFGNDLHEVPVTLIILRQKYQMIITLFVGSDLPVKPGTGRNIDLAAHDRINARFMTCLVKVNTSIHDSMVSDGGAVHPQFLDP